MSRRSKDSYLEFLVDASHAPSLALAKLIARVLLDRPTGLSVSFRVDWSPSHRDEADAALARAGITPSSEALVILDSSDTASSELFLTVAFWSVNAEISDSTRLLLSVNDYGRTVWGRIEGTELARSLGAIQEGCPGGSGPSTR